MGMHQLYDIVQFNLGQHCPPPLWKRAVELFCFYDSLEQFLGSLVNCFSSDAEELVQLTGGC
jgi:hypothetical protein